MGDNIVEIPLSKLRPNPDNVKIFNMAKIDALAKNIEEDGFMGAIEVVKLDDDKYEILSGHRRFEAMKLLKRKTIPAIITEGIDDVSKSRKLLAANINNRELTAMDRARAINYYVDKVAKPSGSKDVIADASNFFNISQSSVKNYRRLTKYSKELQAVLEEGLISYTGLVEDAHKFTKEEQDEIAAQIRQAVADNEGEDIGYKRVKGIIHSYNLAKGRLKAKKERDSMIEKQPAHIDEEYVQSDNIKKIGKPLSAPLGMPISSGFSGMSDISLSFDESEEDIEYANEKIDEAIESLGIALRREVRGSIKSQINQLEEILEELKKKIQ